MLLTEDQAHEQTCPFIRIIVNEEDVLHHEQRPIYVHQSCRGAACKIGWRLEKDPAFLEVDEQPRGFCGAFGRPAGAPL